MVISFSPVLYFHCFFLYGVCDFCLFAVLVEKATICQQARAQKVTEFTPQQWNNELILAVQVPGQYTLVLIEEL